MGSVGELDRLARSFERHLHAENKSPKTVETYGGRSSRFDVTSATRALTQPTGSPGDTFEDFIDVCTTRPCRVGSGLRGLRRTRSRSLVRSVHGRR
jgi:hypothetical protein